MTKHHEYYKDNMLTRYLRVDPEPFDTYYLVGAPTPVYSAVVQEGREFKKIVVTKDYLDTCIKVKVTELREGGARALTHTSPYLERVFKAPYYMLGKKRAA